MFKRLIRALALAATLISLAACSPKLDWRTVQSPQERYTALFPGKPDKLERRIPYQGQELFQSLEAVKIDEDIYSISSIQLPANQVASVPLLIAQLQSNLLERAKASGGSVVTEEGVYQTTSRARLPTKDYFITLHASGGVVQIMRVRWIARLAPNGETWIYQISVLHSNVHEQNAKTFLSKEGYENFFSDFNPE